MPVPESSSLVTRSAVPAGLNYPKYRKYLRIDFCYSCAYCNITESEARAIRFTIDHYEPQTVRSDLVHEYSNLMWACDECNQRKGDRSPPAMARADGHRFFRPDLDKYNDHYSLTGIRIASNTPTGIYSIAALDLNRHTLRRVRELRSRLTDCHRFVAEGMQALREMPFDQLPPSVRSSAMQSIRSANEFEENIVADIDQLLAHYAKSELIDDDEDPEEPQRTKDRVAYLKTLKALHPGEWHGRRPRKTGRASTKKK